MRTRLPVIMLVAAAMTACGGGKLQRDGPPSGSARIPDFPADPVPRPESRSRYGNGPVYEVLGKRYEVLGSSKGYRERGVASWYGTKFHGNLTSSREPYDMYKMTAAHRTLPLPTWVRVRNLRNDRSVVVRVNDRGPFVHNRIIDLSYAAAVKLDMIGDGTSLVEVTAIDFDVPAGNRPVRRSLPATPPPAIDPEPESGPAEHDVYVQVGAFGERANAERRLAVLARAGIDGAFIHEERTTDRVLYRVRIGPVADVVQYDILVEELGNVGIDDPYLVND